MFLMYVDESGDSGLVNSPTQYFVLTGLVVHELRWQPVLDDLVNFRKWCKATHSVKLREEIHSAHMINRPGPLAAIPKHDRLAIVRAFAKQLASIQDISLINVVVNKQNKQPPYDVFAMAWRALIQRFENTMAHRNFSGPANPDDKGLLFPDHSADKKLVRLLRQMRRYNPVPNQQQFGLGYRNLILARVAEDPSFRNSAHSYFIQACDCVAFLLHQSLRPNRYMRKKGGRKYFELLDPILCRVAAPGHPQGIVLL